MFFDKFFFGQCGGMMFAPRLSLVGDKPALFEKFFGVFKGAVIELHGHAGLSPICRPETVTAQCIGSNRPGRGAHDDS